MQQATHQKKMFSGPDYSKQNELWLTEPDTLRRLVGVLGMLLPIMLLFFLWIDTSSHGTPHTAPLESISHYYFTRVSAVFTTTVSLLAIFLLIYKGEGKLEFWFSTLAGIGGLLLVLFPTDNIVAHIALGTPDCLCQPSSMDTSHCYPDAVNYTATVLRNSAFRTDFHFVASGIFLGFLALLSFFVFPYSKQVITVSSEPEVARRMHWRNFLYRLLAVLMFLAIVFIGVGGRILGSEWYQANHLTFWLETIAVESFGLSWLIRGDMLMPHKGN